jgi:23S rRNA pseudouridine1911/1915/1917 synthase
MPWRELERVVAPPEAGPADRLARLMTGLPHAQVRGLFDQGCVLLNGNACPQHATPLQAGDRLRLRYEEGRRYREKARPHEDQTFRLVYEDPHLLVVDKAAGVLSVPTERGERSALVWALSRYLSRGKRVTRRVAIVHRLDRDTSGLLVFAKRQEVADALKNQFRERTPRREYLALIAGVLERRSGTIQSYLATDARLNQVTTRHADQGQLAITHYETVREVPGASLVRVRLETGRRNQIRAHLSERGHPVLGDVRYRPEQARHPRWKWRRMALHACTLGFVHPETGQALLFESPLPGEFAAFLAAASADPALPGPALSASQPARPAHAPRGQNPRRRGASPRTASGPGPGGPRSRTESGRSPTSSPASRPGDRARGSDAQGPGARGNMRRKRRFGPKR